jgi:hypothetical protein
MHGAPSPTAAASPRNVALERWLDELERLDAVLTEQAAYLDAVAFGVEADPPAPFVGSAGLPLLPATLTAYARELLARNAAITERAVAMQAQLRPARQRPFPATTPTRGVHFERQA